MSAVKFLFPRDRYFPFFRIFFLTFTETSRKRSREVGQIMIPAGKQLYICVFGGIFRLIPSRVP